MQFSNSSTVQRPKDLRELATAIVEYLELYHNRQRRPSSLGMLAPVELERRTMNPLQENPAQWASPNRRTPKLPAHPGHLGPSPPKRAPYRPSRRIDL
jgi:hypothetical protein